MLAAELSACGAAKRTAQSAAIQRRRACTSGVDRVPAISGARGASSSVRIASVGMRSLIRCAKRVMTGQLQAG